MKRITELEECLSEIDEIHHKMAFNDLFSVGCHMHATGNQDTGFKLVLTALRACEASTEVIDWVRRELSRGHETKIAAVATVHAEVLNLWRVDGRLPWGEHTGHDAA